MMNYVWDFSQSEMEKYFELMIILFMALQVSASAVTNAMTPFSEKKHPILSFLKSSIF